MRPPVIPLSFNLRRLPGGILTRCCAQKGFNDPLHLVSIVPRDYGVSIPSLPTLSPLTSGVHQCAALRTGFPPLSHASTPTPGIPLSSPPLALTLLEVPSPVKPGFSHIQLLSRYGRLTPVIRITLVPYVFAAAALKLAELIPRYRHYRPSEKILQPEGLLHPRGVAEGLRPLLNFLTAAALGVGPFSSLVGSRSHSPYRLRLVSSYPTNC